MLRRDFISFLVGALVAGFRVAIAQTPSKVYRVGTLLPGPPLDEKSPLEAILLKQLEQHGYMLGKNLVVEARGARGQPSKLGEIVKSLKADGVDVIVVGGFPTALACKAANVPTVAYLGVGDPVATHLIDSLAHPGGNITGISDNAAALATKRLDLIKQAVPNVRRAAMLWNRDDLGMSMRYDASADAARSLGVTVQPERRIPRWEHEAVLEKVQQRLDQDPNRMTLRRQTAEHPFGTIKAWMGATHFLMRRRHKVATEMALNVLAYNMKRVIAILGCRPLLQAIQT